MNTFKRKKKALSDRKNIFVYLFWQLVNRILIAFNFKDFQIIGGQNLPKSGPFLLVANHTSRWDGLLAYRTIDRPANFMVSPNELVGFQGAVLTSMGSFPADPRADLLTHAISLFNKGEGIVVFPEGNIFRDGSTHNFKPGAAKIALAAAEQGIDLPIIPAAINYADGGKVAQIVLGEALSVQEFVKVGKDSNPIRVLSDRMFREVCFLRSSLGCLGDKLALFVGQARRRWPEIARLTKNEIVLVDSSDEPLCRQSFCPVLLTVPISELERKVS